MSSALPFRGPPAARGRDRWLSSLDFLWLELTPKCNLQCSHCYADARPSASGETLPYEKWVDVIRQAHNLGCRNVQFTGGEPSLYPGLPALLREARTLGYESVEVFTNGTRLSRKLRHAFLRYAVDLAFSIYGSHNEVHDAVTGVAGSFTRTIRSIKWALRNGLRVRAGLIEMPLNAPDVAAAEAQLRALGVESISYDSIRGIGRGSGDGGSRPADLMNELCGECWDGKLAVHPDGTVSPCIFSRFYPVGQVSQSLAAVLGSKRLHTFRQELREMNKAKKRSAKRISPSSICAPERPKAGVAAQWACAPEKPRFAPLSQPCAPLKTPCAPLKTPCAPLSIPCAPLKTPCAPLTTPCVPLRKQCTPLRTPCAPLKPPKLKKMKKVRGCAPI